MLMESVELVSYNIAWRILHVWGDVLLALSEHGQMHCHCHPNIPRPKVSHVIVSYLQARLIDQNCNSCVHTNV